MSLSSEGKSNLSGPSGQSGATRSSGNRTDLRRHLPLIWRGMILVYLVLMVGLARGVAQLVPLAS